MARQPMMIALPFWPPRALAGCSTTHPVNYQGLASTSQLTANPRDKDGRIPLIFASSTVDWPRYNAAMLDPVTIYDGPDQQFCEVSKDEKATLAAYARDQFAHALRGHNYRSADTPGPRTLRIHVTLTGVETSTPVIGTLTKIAPAGLLVNTVQTARNKQAAFSGSVSYAVEVYDSTSNRRLRAYVSKQYPMAVDAFSSFGALDAARAGLRNGSQDLPPLLH
jgi:hypothetical protein